MNRIERLLTELAAFIALVISTFTPMPASAAAEPANEHGPLRVSLLTCAPGREIYQLEGHTALRLVREAGNGREGYDNVVNWGVFDFAAPNFVYRFVKGETDYMAWAYPFDFFIEEYRTEGREVVEQVLDLTPWEAARVEQLVANNLLPQNQTYRYNYVKDNCATRPLALIEAAIGSPVTLHADSAAHTGATFRSEMRRYHANYPWYQFGIDMALGSGIDYPVTPRELTFAPVEMRRQLASATMSDAHGGERPLVKETLLLNHGVPGGVTASPTPFPLSPVGVACLLLVITVAVSVRDLSGRSITRWFDSVLYGAFFLAGCLLTFLIFVSVHEATSPNWLYLWLNPFCLIAAAGVWIKRCKRVVYFYQICNFAALILLLAGHHFFGQALNAAFPLLILCDMMRSLTYLWVMRTGAGKSGNKQ